MHPRSKTPQFRIQQSLGQIIPNLNDSSNLKLPTKPENFIKNFSRNTPQWGVYYISKFCNIYSIGAHAPPGTPALMEVKCGMVVDSFTPNFIQVSGKSPAQGEKPQHRRRG